MTIGEIKDCADRPTDKRRTRQSGHRYQRNACEKRTSNRQGSVRWQHTVVETLMDDDNWRFLRKYATVSYRYVQAAESLALPVPWKNNLGSANRCGTPA